METKVIRVKHADHCPDREAAVPSCDCRREDVTLKPGEHHCPQCLRPTAGVPEHGSRWCPPCYWGGPIPAVPI